MRGRTTRKKVGPLLVVSNDRGVGRAAASIPGVEVVSVDSLSVLPLAPGRRRGKAHHLDGVGDRAAGLYGESKEETTGGA